MPKLNLAAPRPAPVGSFFRAGCGWILFFLSPFFHTDSVHLQFFHTNLISHAFFHSLSSSGGNRNFSLCIYRYTCRCVGYL